jgi:hypothetical protein
MASNRVVKHFDVIKDIFSCFYSAENIALVGESYIPQRASWSDGAYKSAINILNLQYGFSITYKK